MTSFVKTQHYEIPSFIMFVLFVGIWKPRAAPMPYHIQMCNPAATHTMPMQNKRGAG